MDKAAVAAACREANSSRSIQKLNFGGASYGITAVDGGWLISDCFGSPLATRSTIDEVSAYITEIEAARVKAQEIMDKANAKVDDLMGMDAKGKKEFKSYEREIEVLSTGTWNDYTFTAQDLEEIVQETNKYIKYLKPPLKFGHGVQDILEKSGLPAAGWIDRLERIGNKIVAYCSGIPEEVHRVLGRGWKRVSCELLLGWQDPETRQKHRVLSALALLGQEMPAVQDLEDIAALAFRSRGSAPAPAWACDGRIRFTFDEGGKNVPNEPKKEEIAFDATKYVTVEAFEAMKTTAETLRKQIEADKATSEKRFKASTDEMGSAIVEFATAEKTLRVLPAQKDVLVALVEAVKGDHVARFTAGVDGKSALKLLDEFVRGLPEKTAIFSQPRGKAGDVNAGQKGALTMEQAIVEAEKVVADAVAKDSRIVRAVVFAEAISEIRRTKGIQDDGDAVLNLRTGELTDRE